MNTAIANEVESIQANARPRFLAACHGLGIDERTTQYLMVGPSHEARILIGMLSGTKAHKQAVLDAYELYLDESGRTMYFPGPKMLMK